MILARWPGHASATYYRAHCHIGGGPTTLADFAVVAAKPMREGLSAEEIYVRAAGIFHREFRRSRAGAGSAALDAAGWRTASRMMAKSRSSSRC